MSLLGIGSGDKKTQTSTVTTSTQQTDSSQNLGTNATLLEGGASFVMNDVSEYVARDALASTASVAETAIGGSADLAKTLGGKALDLATAATETALDRMGDTNANTTLAAQDAISYGRQLAEIGLNAKTSADSGGATAAIDTAGKYTAVVAVAVVLGTALLFFARRKL